MVDLDFFRTKNSQGSNGSRLYYRLTDCGGWRAAGHEFYPEILPTVKLLCKKGLDIVLGMWVKQVVGPGT